MIQYYIEWRATKDRAGAGEFCDTRACILLYCRLQFICIAEQSICNHRAAAAVNNNTMTQQRATSISAKFIGAAGLGHYLAPCESSDPFLALSFASHNASWRASETVTRQINFTLFV